MLLYERQRKYPELLTDLYAILKSSSDWNSAPEWN